MKITNVQLIIGLPQFGSEIETDHMCGSYLGDPEGNSHGGSDTVFKLPTWKEGDKFSLDIPSGVFTGTVTMVRDYGAEESASARSVAAVFGGPQPSAEGVQLFVSGEWNGKEAGLTSGLCAFGGFRANLEYATVVESTLLPAGKEVSYLAYKWAKDARYLLGIGDEEAGKLLVHIAGREPNSAAMHRVFICGATEEVRGKDIGVESPFDALPVQAPAWASK